MNELMDQKYRRVPGGRGDVMRNLSAVIEYRTLNLFRTIIGYEKKNEMK